MTGEVSNRLCDEPSDQPFDARRPRRAGDPVTRLRGFLTGQPPEWLADLLIRATEHDPVLSARLHAAAEAAEAAGTGSAFGQGPGDRAVTARVAEIRTALIEVMSGADDGLGRRAARAWTNEVDTVLTEIEKLVGDGLPEAARDLAEEALDLLEDALPDVDDDGEGFRLLEHTELLHHAACVTLRPDRIALGTYLAERAMASPFLVFERALRTYADVLSYSGRAAYEAAVEARFAQLPRLGPADHHPSHLTSHRHVVTSLMEEIATRRGTDTYVDVVAHDLSSTHRYLMVARRLADDGRPGEALEWLARGTEAFGHDDQLDDLTAELLHRLGRYDEAVEVAWHRFTRHPSTMTYQLLRDHAEAGGSWPARREQALAFLREQPTAPALPPGDGPYLYRLGPGHSRLVEVLLWEGDVDGAWQAARSGGCLREHWLAVARARAADHPQDAVPVLKREIRTTIQVPERPAYATAAALGKELATYYDRLGRSADYTVWIRRIRAENARRPALQDEFTKAGLP